MTPWYEPWQIILSLGLTGPILIWYAYRVYSQIWDHVAALKSLSQEDWLNPHFPEGWNADELSAQLALNGIFLEYDRQLGSIRRSLRSDVYVIILVGFIGTLIGMLGAFTTLTLSISDKGLDPSTAISTLVRGGLSTALVSSLIAAVVAAIVMGYLSVTERTPVAIKARINEACRRRYSGLVDTDTGIEEETHD